MSTERTNDQLRELCKLLLSEERLGIAGLVALAPRTHDDLVHALGIKPSVLARHLHQLQASGLVGQEQKGDTAHYTFNRARLQRWKQQLFGAGIGDGAPEGERAAEKEILERFVREGRLVRMPRPGHKQQIVLAWLADAFHPGVNYPEKAVNEILDRHASDFATLRRMLVDHGFLTRQRGMYQRSTENQPPSKA